MPSPTESTWPTSETSASAPKFWISRFRMAEISAGWIFMLLRPSLPHRSRRSVNSFVGLCAAHGYAQTIQFRTQAGIDHARADLDDQSAEQRGIDVRVELHLFRQLRSEDRF